MPDEPKETISSVSPVTLGWLSCGWELEDTELMLKILSDEKHTARIIRAWQSDGGMNYEQMERIVALAEQYPEWQALLDRFRKFMDDEVTAWLNAPGNAERLLEMIFEAE